MEIAQDGFVGHMLKNIPPGLRVDNAMRQFAECFCYSSVEEKSLDRVGSQMGVAAFRFRFQGSPWRRNFDTEFGGVLLRFGTGGSVTERGALNRVAGR